VGSAGWQAITTLMARRGTGVHLSIRITPAQLPNWSQFVPQLVKVDVIRGAVTAPASDRDIFSAPQTRVVKTWDVAGQKEMLELTYDLGRLDDGFHVRLRGSDGKRLAPGLNGSSTDPAGPAMDVVGNADQLQAELLTLLTSTPEVSSR